MRCFTTLPTTVGAWPAASARWLHCRCPREREPLAIPLAPSAISSAATPAALRTSSVLCTDAAPQP